MRASTAWFTAWVICLLVSLCANRPLAATGILVEPSGGKGSRLQTAASGLAEILALELGRGGWYMVETSTDKPSDGPSEAFPACTIVLEPTAFGTTQRGRAGGLAADLLRLSGKGSRTAQVEFRLRVEDANGSLLWESEYEGIESRHGRQLPSENDAYLAGLNFLSDDFRLSMLGRASYKAIGEALADVYAALPQRGRVMALAGDSAVVDLGSAGHVAKGDRLAVFRDLGIANSLGQVVWPHLVQCGTLQVTDLRPNACLCLLLDGSLEVSEGDAVLPLVLKESYPGEALPDR